MCELYTSVKFPGTCIHVQGYQSNWVNVRKSYLHKPMNETINIYLCVANQWDNSTNIPQAVLSYSVECFRFFFSPIFILILYLQSSGIDEMFDALHMKRLRFSCIFCKIQSCLNMSEVIRINILSIPFVVIIIGGGGGGGDKQNEFTIFASANEMTSKLTTQFPFDHFIFINWSETAVFIRLQWNIVYSQQ